MQESKRKKNYKPLIVLILLIAVFGAFAYFITTPSSLSKAITKIDASNNVSDVKQVWNAYKESLGNNEEFILAVRKKLSSLNLSQEQIEEANAWLPEPPEYINLIIVPDLSRRVTDTLNNPDQVLNDTILLHHIWDCFEKAVRLKRNSKDRLIVDVTDNEQAGGKFRTIANQLVFDLSEHHNQTNRLYFEKVGRRFQDNIARLYALAKQQPLGADYWSYFEHNLSRHLKNSTLYESYRNIVVLITDGYLEPEHQSYTGDAGSREAICKEKNAGTSLDKIFSAENLHIPSVHTDLSNAEVLILEVNERKTGSGCDYDILKKYWTDWLRSMYVKNADGNFFIPRQDATDLTKKEIESVINR